MSEDSDQTIIRKAYSLMRGQHTGEERRSERRQESTDWLKLLIPYAIGAAVIYGQFLVMQEKVERLEDSSHVHDSR